jgi:hypothetical protein
MCKPKALGELPEYSSDHNCALQLKNGLFSRIGGTYYQQSNKGVLVAAKMGHKHS